MFSSSGTQYTGLSTLCESISRAYCMDATEPRRIPGANRSTAANSRFAASDRSAGIVRLLFRTLAGARTTGGVSRKQFCRSQPHGPRTEIELPPPPPSPLVVFCALFKEIPCLPPPPRLQGNSCSSPRVRCLGPSGARITLWRRLPEARRPLGVASGLRLCPALWVPRPRPGCAAPPPLPAGTGRGVGRAAGSDRRRLSGARPSRLPRVSPPVAVRAGLRHSLPLWPEGLLQHAVA